jgi:hypothetical protein
MPGNLLPASGLRALAWVKEEFTARQGRQQMLDVLGGYNSRLMILSY